MVENRQRKSGIFRKKPFLTKYFYIFVMYRPNDAQKYIGLLYKTQHSAQYSAKRKNTCPFYFSEIRGNSISIRRIIIGNKSVNNRTIGKNKCEFEWNVLYPLFNRTPVVIFILPLIRQESVLHCVLFLFSRL